LFTLKIWKKKHCYNNAVIFLHFCDIKSLEKMNKKLEILVKFTLGKLKFLKFSQFLCPKMATFCQKQPLEDLARQIEKYKNYKSCYILVACYNLISKYCDFLGRKLEICQNLPKKLVIS